MKPVIRDIFAPAEQKNFQELNELTAQIKDNKLLSEKAKHDAYKVIENLKYIKINLDYIDYCIGHPNDASIYQLNGDKKKGVLRDHNGTSFHFTIFKSREEASKEFLAAIGNIERIATALKTAKPLVFYVVVNAFEWEKDLGCLGKRVEPFVNTAKAIDAGLNNYQLANVFVNIYVKELSHRNGTVKQAVDDFVKSHNLTDDDGIKIANGLRESFDVELTENLSTFGAASTKLTVNPDNLLAFVQANKKEIVWGYTGQFIQIRFDLTKKEHAKALVEFLHTQDLDGIENANVTLHESEAFYVVRLLEFQAEFLKLPIPSRATSSTVINGTYAQPQGRTGRDNNNNSSVGCVIS